MKFFALTVVYLDLQPLETYWISRSYSNVKVTRVFLYAYMLFMCMILRLLRAVLIQPCVRLDSLVEAGNGGCTASLAGGSS